MLFNLLRREKPDRSRRLALERTVEGELVKRGFEIHRMAFVRSAGVSPVIFDFVARRGGLTAYVDVKARDRVGVGEILASASALFRQKAERGTQATFLVTDGKVDELAKESAREFGIQIISADRFGQALSEVTGPVPSR